MVSSISSSDVQFLIQLAKQQAKQGSKFKILVAGLPGMGKSTVLNSIMGEENKSFHFPVGKTVKSVTSRLSVKECRLFGNIDFPELELYDVPGFLDASQQKETSTDKVLAAINDQLKGAKFDYILWIRKIFDIRYTAMDKLILRIINGFVNDLKPQQFALVVTYWDMADEEMRSNCVAEKDELKKALENDKFPFPQKVFYYDKKGKDNFFGLSDILSEMIESAKVGKINMQEYTPEQLKKDAKETLGENSCIDWESHVWCLRAGIIEKLPLRSLNEGDFIFVDSLLEKPVFEPILLLNKHPGNVFVIQFDLESSHTISLVLNQIMYIQRLDQLFSIPAEDIKVGDRLCILDEKSPNYQWKAITQKRLRVASGVAHLYTPSFRYFANGVLCSSDVKGTIPWRGYLQAIIYYIWQKDPQLLRLLYQVKCSLSAAINYFEDFK